MKKYKIGNALWAFSSEKDTFEDIESAWAYLSDAFARARTSDPSRRFYVYLQVREENKYGFIEWQTCKKGYAQYIK